jgi:hypothetical protein
MIDQALVNGQFFSPFPAIDVRILVGTSGIRRNGWLIIAAAGDTFATF